MNIFGLQTAVLFVAIVLNQMAFAQQDCALQADQAMACASPPNGECSWFRSLGHLDLASCRAACAAQGRGTCQFTQFIGEHDLGWSNCSFADKLPGEICGYARVGRGAAPVTLQLRAQPSNGIATYFAGVCNSEERDPGSR